MMETLFAILVEMFNMRLIVSIEPNKTEDAPCKARALPQVLQIILIVFQTGPYGNKEDYGL